MLVECIAAALRTLIWACLLTLLLLYMAGIMMVRLVALAKENWNPEKFMEDPERCFISARGYGAVALGAGPVP